MRNTLNILFALALGLAAGSASAKTVDGGNWADVRTNLVSGLNVKLTADIEQDGDECYLADNHVVRLDLNGHTLTAASGKRLFYLDASGCELTLTDTSAEATGTTTRNDTLSLDGGVVYVNSGRLIVDGGTFTGKATNGGFAYVAANGRLTMNGGTVTGCSATTGGAAFYVAREASAVINGGTISQCTAGSGALWLDGTVTVNGGTFANCSGASGGAIYGYNNGTLTVNGGTFSNCSASESGAIMKIWGWATVNGGVYENIPKYGFFQGDADATALKIKGGVFNKKRSDTSCYFSVTFEGTDYAFTGSDSATRYLVGSSACFSDNKLAAGTFTFDPTAQIYADVGLALAPYTVCTANRDGTYTVAATKDPVSVSNWTDLRNAILTGVSVILTDNIAQDGDVLALSANQIATIDLNGRTLTAKSGTHVFNLSSSGSELTITDTSAAGTGKISCSAAYAGEGGIAYLSSGHLILNGGTFTGQTDDAHNGGFAYVRSSGRITMNGGVLTDCYARYGGAIFIDAGASGTINGGTLTNCSVLCTGGAVHVAAGGTLTVNGGAILNCASSKGTIYSDGTSALNGCVTDDQDLLYNGAELGDNWEFAGVGETGLYVVGRDVEVANEKLSGGTFAFDPRGEEYADAGFNLVSYATVRKNDDNTYTVAVTDPVEATTWTAVRDGLAAGFGVTLAADIEATGAMCNLGLECAGKELALDLNGHTITHASTTERFLTLSAEAAGCTLTILDSATNGYGRIVHTGGAVATNGACLFVDAGTAAVLKGGLIADFASTGEGGAVYVNAESGNFTFQGGVISNCTATTCGAIANKGTTTLAGGVTDDASVTNAANHVTFAENCTFVGNGAGLYLIGGNPKFAGDFLESGLFTFDPTLPLYSAAGLNLADYATCIGLRGKVWRVLTVKDRQSLLVNGSFELGTAMPPEGEAGSVSESGVAAWTGTDGATVYTKGWADANGLSVLAGEYAVCLAPGACVEQAFTVLAQGSSRLTAGYCGAEGATLVLSVDGISCGTISVTADDWRYGRHGLTILTPGVHTLVLSNATAAADGFLVLDDLAVEFDGGTGVSDDISAVNNGDFETGSAMPSEDGETSLDDAGVYNWTSPTGGASVYGAAATNDYPCGVASGTYALALNEHATVSQTVFCPPDDGTLVVGGVTGRWYAVTYFYAAVSKGETPTVRVLSQPILGGATNELATATANADGSWSSVSALAFLPVGTNAVTFVNDSNARAVVDDVTVRIYASVSGELVVNGSFEFGSGLPSANDSEDVAPAGQAEPSAWTVVSNTATLFGRRARRRTLVGALYGNYSIGLKNGARLEQDFLVPSSGTYRVAFAIAERYASGGENHPSVTVSVDGADIGTFTALKSGCFDIAVAFCDLEPGTHALALTAAAGGEQMLLMDAVSIRLKRDLTAPQDVTGVSPVIRVVPSPTTLSLLAKGAELSSCEIDPDQFSGEDFSSTAKGDFFLLEGHAGAYAHPEYRPMEQVEFMDSCTVSLGGCLRGGDGPLLTYRISPVAESDKATVLSIESSCGGQKFSFVSYPLTNGCISTGTELFSVPVTNLVSEGLAAHFAAVWRDNTFSFYANGHVCGTKAFAPGTPFVFEAVRLGTYPEGTDPAEIDARRCGTFALSDVRVYTEGLTDSQVALLSAEVRSETVQVTLYDATEDRSYGSYPRAVGAYYGALASSGATRPGYGLVGWSLSPESGAPFVTPTTIVTETTDHRLYAKWTNNVYTVTYDFCGYPFAENESQTIYAGETYSLPTGFEVDGVAFNGWTNANGLVVSPGTVFPADGRYEDATLYASFDDGFGTLVFEPHNGEPATVREAVLIGSLVADQAPDDPERSGYTFLGWFSAEAGGEPLTEETQFAHVNGETWHAQWSGDGQTVTWRAPAGCRGDVQTTVSRSGGAYELPEIVPSYTNELAESQLFYGWGRNVGTNGLEIIAIWDWENEDWLVNGDVATWTNAHDAVALWWTACPFDANGGLVDAEKTWLYPGERYDAWDALPTPAREGYTFSGWRTNVVEGAQVMGDTIVTEPLPSVLVAAWTPVSVRVSLDPNDGVTDTNGFPCVMVQYEQPYGEFPTPTRPGYALDSWHYILEDGVEITPETIVSTYADHTCVASWTNAWYKMTYVINGVKGKSFMQRYENPWQDLYVPPQDLIGEHQVFEGWALEETDEPIAEGDVAKMTRDGNLIALLSGEACTIALDAVDGVLDADWKTITLEYGDTVVDLPEAGDVWRPGCTFKGWFTQDGTEVKNGDTWYYSGTTALHAEWEGINPHQITYERNMTPSASPEAVRDVKFGCKMPTVAKPDRTDGATFLGWYFGDTPCTDADGKPLAGYEKCPWEVDVTLMARWTMPRDNFAGAYELEDGVTNTVVGVEATDEPGEPNHDLEGVLRATHWYKFAAKAGKTVRIAFEDLTGLDPMVQLVVYSGTSLDDLEEMDDGSHFEMDDPEAVLEWTPESDGTYYLALAQASVQDNESAGLQSYRISATGVGAPEPASAWTDPSTMPGDTQQEKNYNALIEDGFSPTVASRLADANTYKAFTQWAGVGTDDEISPSVLTNMANPILAAAYGVYTPPEGEVVVASCETTTNATGVTAMRATLKVTGDFTAGGATDDNLLKAALGVTGSTTLGGEFSTDTLTYTVEAVDKANSEITVLVTPKKVEDEPPSQFFIKGVTY